MNDSKPLRARSANRAPGKGGHRAGAGMVSTLLRFAAATAAGGPSAGASAFQWEEVTDAQIQYVLDGGLGPLLFHATRETHGSVPPGWRDALHASDLTARVNYGNLCDAMLEILDACNIAEVPVTLLKGISIADQYYPQAHFRPMGDIDILIQQPHCEWLEEALRRRGFEPKVGFEVHEGEPHRAPLVDPKRGVWIEIHTALFPDDDRLRSDSLFSVPQIAAQRVASTFHGRPVHRLSRELQLAYIASYWIRDLSQNPFHPSLVIPLIDAIVLLNASGHGLDADLIVKILDNEVATASLYIMLSYITSRGLHPALAPILQRLATRQRIVGAPELRIISSMIDTNLVDGIPFLGQFGNRHPMIGLSIFRSLLEPGSHVGKVLKLPWSIFFPPWIADRYTLRYQVDRFKRFAQS